MSDVTLDQPAEQAAEALRKARIFIEYVRYELEPELMPGAQFPSQQCADKEIARIDAALGSMAEHKAATQALREQLAQHEADLEAAAGDLLVPLPEPATDAAKMLRANRLLIAERHTLQQQLAQVTQERDELVKAAHAEGTGAALTFIKLADARWGHHRERAEAAESALTAQREELERLRITVRALEARLGVASETYSFDQGDDPGW